MINKFFNYFKNFSGWHTFEKFVVFSIDDYGNVRLNSKESRDKLISFGVPLNGRFDYFDALETKQDLDALFETLCCVKDIRGSHAIFTPYALSANPNFDSIIKNKNVYLYEPLPSTFERLTFEQPSSYSGAWNLWKEGIDLGIFNPQFHGREHLNIQLFEHKLRLGDTELFCNIENRSMAGISNDVSLPFVDFNQSFGYWDHSVIPRHKAIIDDGINLFKKVFGYYPITFTPPAQKIHPELYSFVETLGIRAIDKPFFSLKRLNGDHTIREFNSLGYRKGQNHITIVRNVVFEPTNNPSFDSVNYALSQISAAFLMKKPAIISSHRVNYSGHIDENNRHFGLSELKRLLQEIVKRWPDVQFINATYLLEKIQNKI